MQNMISPRKRPGPRLLACRIDRDELKRDRLRPRRDRYKSPRIPKRSIGFARRYLRALMSRPPKVGEIERIRNEIGRRSVEAASLSRYSQCDFGPERSSDGESRSIEIRSVFLVGSIEQRRFWRSRVEQTRAPESCVAFLHGELSRHASSAKIWKPYP